MEHCIFCKIVAGTLPSHTIWEDEDHVAFLTPFPNTEGFSVVIPKKHYPSYAFELPDDVLGDLVLAAKKVGLLLDKSFDDVGRTGLIFEGFGVDHIHAKLVPMHGTASDEWKELHAGKTEYLETYPGYLASWNGPEQDTKKLADLAEKIRQA